MDRIYKEPFIKEDLSQELVHKVMEVKKPHNLPYVI